MTFSAGSGRVTPSSTLKSIGAGGGNGATGTVSVPKPSASVLADFGISDFPGVATATSSFVSDRLKRRRNKSITLDSHIRGNLNQPTKTHKVSYPANQPELCCPRYRV